MLIEEMQGYLSGELRAMEWKGMEDEFLYQSRSLAGNSATRMHRRLKIAGLLTAFGLFLSHWTIIPNSGKRLLTAWQKGMR